MDTLPQPDIDEITDTIRKTIRVFGSQPAHVSNPEGTRKAARLIAGRLTRAGVPVRWHEGTHGTPLLVAGNGPIAFCTYLDDSHPGGTDHTGIPPKLADGIVNSPGIERKAGVLAIVAPLLANPERASELSVIVETDRHSGSHTLQHWIDVEEPAFAALAWEVSDLPLPAPVVVRSAAGSLIVEIKLTSTRRRVEPVFGTALPDLGIALASLLATLKTSDDEVRLEGFYDAIGTPGADEFDALVQIAPGVSRWLHHVAGDERELSTTHMTLGMFCAPSITVRGIEMSNDEDYLPESASAIVEFQLLPGQNVDRVLQGLIEHVSVSPFTTNATVLRARAPVAPSPGILLPAHMKSIPIAPGPSPASIFNRFSIPILGYAVVERNPDRDVAGLAVESIAGASRFLMELAALLARQSDKNA